MAYRPWAFAPTEWTRKRDAERFSEDVVRRREAPVQTVEPPKPKSRLARIGGFVDKITPDAAEGPLKAAGRGALTAINAPLEYAGKPAFALASGQTAAKRVYDPQSGRYYREKPGFRDVAQGFAEALSRNPGETYQEGRQAFNERLANPEMNAASRTLLQSAADPLNLVGPGAVKGALRLAPAAVQGSRGANFARWALENPSGVSLGAIGGATVAAGAAEKANAPDWVQAAAPLVGGLAGGIAGGRAGARYARGGIKQFNADLATAQGRRGREPAFGLGIEEMPNQPVKRLDLERLPHDQIKHKLSLFQAKDVPEGKGFDEARVQDIIAHFDPNRLEPGIAVHDSSSGEYYVISGHHRLEVQKRLAAEGKGPKEGTWQVFDADLSDPSQANYLQRLADYANYAVADTNLRTDLNVYQRGLARGETHDQIIDAMRSLPKREANDLKYLAGLPQDILERAIAEPGLSGIAAEIGKARLTYKLSETDVQGLFLRYHEGRLPRTELAAVLEKAGRAINEIRAKEAQKGFGGADWEETHSRVLDAIDKMAALEKNLASDRQELVSLRNALAKQAGKNERLRPQLQSVADNLTQDIKDAEARLDAARGEYQDALKRGFEGTPADAEAPIPRGDETGGIPSPEGSRGAGEAPTVKRVDLFGNVEDTFQTEAELAGIRQTQGAMDLGKSEAPTEPISTPGSVGEAGEPALALNEPPSASTAEPGPQPQFESPPGTAPSPSPGGPPPKLDYTSDYTILGVDENATAEQIKAAYRAQARLYHPDVSESADALAEMKAINNAFDRVSAKVGGRSAGQSSAYSSTDEWAKAYYEARRRAQEEARAYRAAMDEELARFRQYRKEHMGEGFPGGRATGGVGGTAEQPPLGGMGAVPPAGTGPGGAGGTQPFGSAPHEDMLNAPTREAMMAEGARGTWKERVDERVRKAFNKMTPELERVREKVNPVLRAKQRMDLRRHHLVAFSVDRNFAVMADVGIEPKAVNGEHHMFADGQDVGLFDDVIEGSTDAGRTAYLALSPEQKQGLAIVRTTMAEANGTKLFHGAELRIDPDIPGDYLGRRVISREYINQAGERVTMEKPDSGQPSQRVGAQRTKSRTVESVEELLRLGFKTEDPRTAMAAILNGKYLDAEDAWLASNFSPLQVKSPRSTVGLAQVNQPAFNQQWYTPEVGRRIQQGLEPRRSAIPAVRAINAVLTPLRASFDISASLQQGLRMWLSDPVHAADYWWTVARSLKDEKLYEGLLLRFDDEARAMGLQNGMADMIRNDLRYQGAITGSELTFSQGLTEWLGKAGKGLNIVGKGFEKSNEHFDRLLNVYRTHMALAQAKRLQASGLTGQEFWSALSESNRAVNRSFGWTDTQPTGLEEVAAFAPRYTRATIETLVYAVSRGGIKGSQARAHMALMLAEGAALVWTVNTLRGHETDFDPRSNNFLRFRDVAGLDISPFGTYGVLFRTIAQGIGGEQGESIGLHPNLGVFRRFAEAKASPALGLLYWPLKGETYLGEPLTFGSWAAAGQSAKELAPTFLPFSAQTLAEKGLKAEMPGVTDIGSTLLSGTGLSSTPVTATEKRNFAREDSAQAMFGRKYDDLTGAEKSKVNASGDVAKEQAAADRNTLTKVGDRSKYLKATLGSASKLDFLSEGLKNGRITGNEFRDQYRIIQAELRGSRDVLELGGGKKDADLTGWFALYDKHTLPDGTLDWDALDSDQVAYEAAHPGVQDKLLRTIGAQDNEVVREYRAAQKQAKEYYDIPSYRGMTAEESQKATRVLMKAQDMVSFGQVRAMSQAFGQVAKTDPDGVRLARRAQKVGSNPERKRFRQSHPELARFYSDI